MCCACAVRLTSGATRTLVRVQYTRRVVLLVQVAWLMRAVQLVDLTTLTSVDGLANVSRLCAKALRPVRADVCAALRIDPRRASPLRSTLLNNTVQYPYVCVYYSMTENHVGAVCVYPNAVSLAARCLYGEAGRLGESEAHEAPCAFTAPEDEYFALPPIDDHSPADVRVELHAYAYVRVHFILIFMLMFTFSS